MEYIDKVRQDVQERKRVKDIAEELLRSCEYSSARDILRRLLKLQGDGDSKLGTLLQIAECDIMLNGKLAPETDEDISALLKEMFFSYVMVEENAHIKSGIASLLLYMYACRAARQEATPDEAVTKIEKYVSVSKASLTEMIKDPKTKKVASRASYILPNMVEEIKAIQGAESGTKAHAEARCLNAVGYTYNELARCHSAKVFLEEAWHLMKNQFGADAARYDIFSAIENNLGFSYSHEGDHAKAAFYYGKALADVQKAEDIRETQRSERSSKYKTAYEEHVRHASAEQLEALRIAEEAAARQPKPKPKHEEIVKDEEVVKIEGDAPVREEQELEEEEKEMKEDEQESRLEPEEKAQKPSGYFVSVGNGIQVDHSQCLQENHWVFKGLYQGKEVAVKRTEFNVKCKEELENVMRMKSHPNTVECKAYTEWESVETPGLKYLYIVMDLCSSDTLLELSEDDSFSRSDRLIALKHTMQGLSHIHNNGIVHGDLKPSNILRSLGGRCFKVADHGLGKTQRGTRTRVGSYGWTAPEREMTPKFDIYSAGIVFYHVLTNGGTYAVVDLENLPGPDSAVASDLINLMLQSDPADRPATRDVLKHPFFWDDGKRISFLRDVTECVIKTEEDVQQVVDLLEEEIGEDLGKNWIESIDSDAVFGQDPTEVIAKLNELGVGDQPFVGTIKQKSPIHLILVLVQAWTKETSTSLTLPGRESDHQLNKIILKLFTSLYSLIRRQLDLQSGSDSEVDLKHKVDWTEVSHYFGGNRRRLGPSWTEKKKFQFLCSISSDAELGSLYEDKGRCVFGENWMETLGLKKEEKKAVQAKLIERGSKIRVEKWAVYNRALILQETPNPKSMQSLLVFMSNVQKHYKELGNQVKAILGDDSEVVWGFFASRFPQLFATVHEAISESPEHESLLNDF